MGSSIISYVGPPNSDIWEVGQITVDSAGNTWQCTGRGVGGQPGTAFNQIGEPVSVIAALASDLGPVYNASIFGCVADSGVTDNGPMLALLIAAAQVFHGTANLDVVGGVYGISSEIKVISANSFTWTSTGGATIKSNGCSIVNWNNQYITATSSSSTVTGLEISKITFDATGGHCFYGINWNGFNVHDNRFIQRSANFSALSSAVGSNGNNLLSGIFYNNKFQQFGAVRTIPLVNFVSYIGGGIAFVEFDHNNFNNHDNDSQQPYIFFDGNETGVHGYTNALQFNKNTYDNARGGCVMLLSTQGSSFDGESIVDTFSGSIGAQGMYYIGASSGGSQWASQSIKFTNMNRDLQGPNGTTSWDIYLESTCDTISIDTYECRDIPGSSVFHASINANGCTNVTLQNLLPSTIYSNPAVSGVQLQSGGNIVFTGALSGATQPPIALPSDAGYLAWTFDPSMMQGNTKPAASGDFYTAEIFIRTAASISNIVYWIDTAGASASTGSNLVGLYTTAGVLLSGSADQSSNWYGSAGVKTAALTTPQAVTAGTYVVGFIANGGTLPGFGRGAGALSGGSASQWPANAGSSGGSSRYGAITGVNTSLPAPYTPGSFGTLAPITLWVAVK